MIATTPRADRGADAETEIHADLVDTLFGTTGSFVAGLFGGLVAPLIAWLMTDDRVYLYFCVVIACLGLFRVSVQLAYGRAPVMTRRAEAHKWERLYAIGGVGFMTAVGVSVAIMFREHVDDVLGYYGVVIVMSGVGSLAGRNAGRPNIVIAQVLGLVSPLAIVSFLHEDTRSHGLTPIFILLTISVTSTTKFLHANLEAALRNGHDASLQRRRLGHALNSMSHGLCMGGADLTVTVVNHRVFEFFGIVAATTPIRLEALATAIARDKHMPDEEAHSFGQRWAANAGARRASYFSQVIGDKIFDFRCEPADAGGFVTVIEDVTEQRRAVREIERIAHFDELTGLPNRLSFQNRLERELRHVAGQGRPLVLLSLDLDRFKEVNDTLGHAVGDQLLRAAAQRMREIVAAPDMVARFGGDEFCVLLHPFDGLQEVEATAARFIQALSQPFTIDDHTILVGASVGAAVAPRDALTFAGLMQCADLALYRAKFCGRGCATWFEPAMQEALLTKRRIETELRRALDEGQLALYYQPIVDSRFARVTCLEALLRWRHPERGLVSPAEFIPVAEETGLIVELGEWALRRACRDAMSWPADIRVAVNLSPRQFQQSNLLDLVSSTLAAEGLAPDRLELEITETILMQDTDDVSRKASALAAMGVRLSLDDFGTGYSSLCYLNNFPVKKVKIDRSFAKHLASPKTQAIVGAVALLARDLDIELVAEGVETNEQLAVLAGKNVFMIQGFLFSPPRPLEELAPRLGCWGESGRSAAA
jgi:diguanylate cyclase (GGDEF)-like protein